MIRAIVAIKKEADDIPASFYLQEIVNPVYFTFKTGNTILDGCGASCNTWMVACW